MSDPYPFESDDEDEIGELDLESVDGFAEARVTVGQLVGENESWRFGHVIIDEAQDLTPMQWRMIMRRVRGRSLTIVGDLAQRTTGEPGRWSDHLPAELAGVDQLDLTINYRSPTEIHELAVATLREFAPGIAPSRAIRSAGADPTFHHVSSMRSELARVVEQARNEVAGQVAVLASDVEGLGLDTDDPRLRILTPGQAKGLEFDAVVLVEPAEILATPGGPALLYIALTRATQRLMVVHEQPLPPVLGARAAS